MFSRRAHFPLLLRFRSVAASFNIRFLWMHVSIYLGIKLRYNRRFIFSKTTDFATSFKSSPLSLLQWNVELQRPLFNLYQGCVCTSKLQTWDIYRERKSLLATKQYSNTDSLSDEPPFLSHCSNQTDEYIYESCTNIGQSSSLNQHQN